ncbi:MAG: hypothetical protein EA351_11900 [Gemmatimonadales bacterium]|nr:MAG: hypothetical protein EA351_11900 [Gemmatimonadales bacterium]
MIAPGRVAGGLLATLVSSTLLLGGGEAQAQEVSWALVPTYEELRWDDAFGLERTRTLGGRLSIDFGPLFSLQPFYSRATDIGLREGLTAPDGVSDRYRAESGGADLQVNLASGTLRPFVTAGGGILRTDDDAEGRRDRILLRAGGGVAFAVTDRIAAEIFARSQAVRLPAPFIPGAVEPEDFPEDGVVSSLVLGSGLRIPVGAVSATTGPRPGILPGLFVEPFAGRLDFHGDFGLDRQELAGVRAGIDLNRNVGLRAWGWRGVDSDFSETQPIEGLGGEMQFNLGTGSGVVPFLVAGGGQLRFRDGFEDLEGMERANLNHLVLGGGVGIGMGDRLRLEVGARNLLMTIESELEDVTEPDDLRSNWLYSAGLSLSMGGRPGVRAGAPGVARAEPDEPRPARPAPISEVAEQVLRERAETTEDAELRAELIREIELAREARLGSDTLEGRRTMTIPVPEVGEIILRFGAEYAVRAPDRVEGVDPADLAALERRILEALSREGADARLPELVRQIVREELRLMGVRPGEPIPMRVLEDPTLDPGRIPSTRRLEALEPYSGFQVSAPTQMLFALRTNLGEVSDLVPVELVPEIAFGVGERDPSLLLGMNARFGYEVGGTRVFEPYLLGGIAITNRRFISLNAGYGVRFNLREEGAAGYSPRLFAEHQGVGFYDDHRFLFGVLLPR